MLGIAIALASSLVFLLEAAAFTSFVYLDDKFQQGGVYRKGGSYEPPRGNAEVQSTQGGGGVV